MADFQEARELARQYRRILADLNDLLNRQMNRRVTLTDRISDLEQKLSLPAPRNVKNRLLQDLIRSRVEISRLNNREFSHLNEARTAMMTLVRLFCKIFI